MWRAGRGEWVASGVATDGGVGVVGEGKKERGAGGVSGEAWICFWMLAVDERNRLGYPPPTVSSLFPFSLLLCPLHAVWCGLGGPSCFEHPYVLNCADPLASLKDRDGGSGAHSSVATEVWQGRFLK